MNAMANAKTVSSPSWLTQLAMVLSGLVAYGYNFSHENIFNQMPAVMALVDPTLYSQDFYVQAMTEFTPRSYYYYALALPVKLGMSLPVVCFIYFAIAFAAFTLGLYAIGRHLGQSKLTAAALVLLGLSAVNGTVGHTDLFRRTPIPSVYAIGIAIWGIYFCLKHQWTRGYLLLGCSCLLQFLIGLLPGMLLTPALLFHSWRTKRPQQIVWAGGGLMVLAGLIYLPMVLGGTTSSDLLSNWDFVWLYGYVRHPHHLVMSTFSFNGWRRLAHFVLAGFACLYGSRQLDQDRKITLGLAILTGLLLVVVGYVFVEIYPIAFVAKLQFARVTPFVFLMSLIAIAVYAGEYYRRGNQLLALLLIASPTIAEAGGLVTLILVGLTLIKPGPAKFWQYLRKQTNQFPQLIFVLFFIVLTIIYFYEGMLFASFAYPFFMDEFPQLMKRLRVAIQGLIVVFAIFVGLHLTGVVVHRSLGPLHRAIKLSPIVEGPVEALAVEFKRNSPVDALVLVPPSDQEFRFYSQRSVVVNYKGFPFTDAGIVTWQQRMESLLGKMPGNVKAVLEPRFSQLSGAELAAIAAQYGATHILTRQDWQSDIPGSTSVNQQDDWALWAVDPG